jgi:hypothetical protein
VRRRRGLASSGSVIRLLQQNRRENGRWDWQDACDFVLVSQKSSFLEIEVSRLASNRLSHDHVIREVDLQNSCTRGASLLDTGNQF